MLREEQMLGEKETRVSDLNRRNEHMPRLEQRTPSQLSKHVSEQLLGS